jgi:hypothetical protein
MATTKTPAKKVAKKTAPTHTSTTVQTTTTSTPPDTSVLSLQTFDLLELQQFTKEKVYSTSASKDFHLFYVGRDDVHDILKYVLSRVTVSLYLNMFGFDDDELNAIIMEKARDPQITMLITLDKSQASGPHEKALLASDLASNPTAYNTSFVIGESATRQISHTKGFVADGKVAAEGSTNWSGSGEGTEVTPGVIGGPNYKAQNNTQSVITDPDTISRFTAELIAEHMSARLTADPGMKSEQKVPLGTKGTELKPPAKTPAKAPAKTAAKKSPPKTPAKAPARPPAKAPAKKKK